MKCKHEHASTKYGECTFENGVIVYEVEYRECLDCGVWLPMGPAKDDGEHAEQVAIEVRAAEIVCRGRDAASMWLSNEMSDCERDGWETHMRDWDHIRIEGAEWAGWLARCIATHDTEQEG